LTIIILGSPDYCVADLVIFPNDLSWFYCVPLADLRYQPDFVPPLGKGLPVRVLYPATVGVGAAPVSVVVPEIIEPLSECWRLLSVSTVVTSSY
jgi:hypothetical protein